jgi:hypothetical protein
VVEAEAEEIEAEVEEEKESAEQSEEEAQVQDNESEGVEEETEEIQPHFTVRLPPAEWVVLQGPDGEKRGAKEVAPGRYQFITDGELLWWYNTSKAPGWKEATRKALKGKRRVPKHWKPFLVEDVGEGPDDWRIQTRHHDVEELMKALQ